MKYIHQMLVSKELGGAGLIGIHLASFLRAKGQEYRLWIPGQGAALQKIRTLALDFIAMSNGFCDEVHAKFLLTYPLANTTDVLTHPSRAK